MYIFEREGVDVLGRRRNDLLVHPKNAKETRQTSRY